MGPQGLKATGLSCLLSSLLPLPLFYPFLTPYSLHLRHRLLTTYNFYPPSSYEDDDDINGERSCGLSCIKHVTPSRKMREVMVGCLCMPCALHQQYNFLIKEEEKGSLRFPWEKGKKG